METLPIETKKSFWKKPEGKTGLIINGAIIASIFYFWKSILPFLLLAAVDTLHLIITCSIIAAILYVIFDSNFRRFTFYLYKSLLRKITQLFVDLDPIGILKTFIEKIKNKKTELETAVAEIRGQRQKLNRTIEKNTSDLENSIANLKASKEKLTAGNETIKRQASRIEIIESKQIERLDSILKTQQNHMKKYDFIIEVLTRYGEVCDDTIIDMSNEIKFREQEREQARSFNKGMSAAFGILKGMPEDKEMYDTALESLEREYTQKMGEVENALDLTKNVILQADFNDVGAIAKADALLNKWKGNNIDVQLNKNGQTKQNLIVAAEEQTIPQFNNKEVAYVSANKRTINF